MNLVQIGSILSDNQNTDDIKNMCEEANKIENKESAEYINKIKEIAKLIKVTGKDPAKSFFDSQAISVAVPIVQAADPVLSIENQSDASATVSSEQNVSEAPMAVKQNDNAEGLPATNNMNNPQQSIIQQGTVIGEIKPESLYKPKDTIQQTKQSGDKLLPIIEEAIKKTDVPSWKTQGFLDNVKNDTKFYSYLVNVTDQIETEISGNLYFSDKQKKKIGEINKNLKQTFDREWNGIDNYNVLNYLTNKRQPSSGYEDRYLPGLLSDICSKFKKIKNIISPTGFGFGFGGTRRHIKNGKRGNTRKRKQNYGK